MCSPLTLAVLLTVSVAALAGQTCAAGKCTDAAPAVRSPRRSASPMSRYNNPFFALSPFSDSSYYDPFAALDHVQRALDHSLSLLDRGHGLADVLEIENAYEITLDAAGYKANELKVEISGNSLRIHGHHACDSRKLCIERTFDQSYQLPAETDHGAITSHLSPDHVLQVVVPKAAKPRTVTISHHASPPPASSASAEQQDDGVTIEVESN